MGEKEEGYITNGVVHGAPYHSDIITDVKVGSYGNR